MFANQILESITAHNEKFFAISKSWIIDCLKSSVKFHLGEFSDSINNIMVKLSGSPLFQNVALPYPKTLLTYTQSQDHINEDKYEKSSKCGILAIQRDKERILIIQFPFYDEKRIWLAPLYGLEYSIDKCNIINVIKEEELVRRGGGKSLSDDQLREYCKQIQSEASVFHVFLALLSCKNIVEETIYPPNKLNKSRIRKGKLPIYDYKVLNIQVPSVKYKSNFTDSEALERLHRVHLCRGHFKEFSKESPLFGKHIGRYWWQPIVRGKGDGMINKDYQIILNAKGAAT